MRFQAGSSAGGACRETSSTQACSRTSHSGCSANRSLSARYQPTAQ
jgi:hypothetical protein